jgi:hypothetical protein
MLSRMSRMSPSILCISCSLAIMSACNFQASSSTGKPPSSGKPAASDGEGKPAASVGKPVAPAGKPVPTEPTDDSDSDPDPGAPGHRAPVDPAVRAKPGSDVSCSVSPEACKRSERGAREACSDERIAELEALCTEALAPLAAADVAAFEAKMSRGMRFQRGKKAIVGIDAVIKAIDEAGGLRPFFGLDVAADIIANVTEDCGQCRRPFVSIDVTTPTGAAAVMVEGAGSKISALTLPGPAAK